MSDLKLKTEQPQCQQRAKSRTGGRWLLGRHCWWDIAVKVVGKRGKCCLNCVLKLSGLVWYGKVFICFVISETVCAGVQILYQKCLMTVLCFKAHVTAEGLCSPLQPAVNIKYLTSAADNIIDEFSPCIPGLMLKQKAV